MPILPKTRVLSAAVACCLTLPLVGSLNGQSSIPAAAFSIAKFSGLERAGITADFDGDGDIDVIGSAGSEAAPEIVIFRGRGDGSLDASRPLGVAGVPLAALDLNGDGRMDVLFQSGGGVSVLPGNGNGTFASARLVHAGAAGLTAAAGVFDSGNSVPDVVVIADAGDTSTIYVYPGHGDFTFGPPVTQPGPVGVSILRAVQLDDQPPTDLVAALGGSTSVAMMRNTGAAAFEIREFDLHDDVGDVRAADLDGNGTIDVVASMFAAPAQPENQPANVAILWDGFDATSTDVYDTGVNGEYALALGDFTRDGRVDIATGNWSTHFDDNLGRQLWSSVSILEGLVPGGTPRFRPSATFALGNVNREGYTTSWSLDAADLNGDGHVDLVHAPGAILLNRAAQPNRAPTAFAGSDRTYTREDPPLVRGAGVDPDGHWLEHRWSNGAETPWFSFGGIFGAEPGVYDFTLTVDDAQGGVDTDSATIRVADTAVPTVRLTTPTIVESAIATGSPYPIEWTASDANGAIRFFHLSYSADGGRTFSPITECLNLPSGARSCTWQNPGPAADHAFLRIEALYEPSQSWVDLSNEFRLAAPGTFLPAGWRSDDIGNVAAAGSASELGGTWTVRGSGADIWGTADEFQYAFRTVRGDFDVIAHVASVESVHDWTKAGLMVRPSILSGTWHASLFATPTTKGISAQFRPADGASSVEHARVAVGPPVWLKLMRRGNQITGAWRRSTSEEWRTLPVMTIPSEASLLVGLAVTSHEDGNVATATFDNVTVTSPGGEWRGTDVGAVGAPGGATFDDGAFAVNASGADIWGTADEFHYLHQPVTGDFELTARVTSVEDVDRWTKAGLMVREGTGAGARHAFVLATPASGNGLAFQRRTSTGGGSIHTAGPALRAPVWLRLVRSGNVVTGSYRTSAGGAWTAIASQTFAALPATVQVGLAVTSHLDGAVATATFDDVRLTRFQATDVGAVGIPGATTIGTGGLTMDASGADIWGTADGFRYYYRPWTGDGSITVRVVNIENTHPWAKAGVMFRETLAAGSKHVTALVTPTRGVAAQYRGSTDGTSANVMLASGTAPEWLRLTRRGDAFTAAASNDGTTWQPLGSITVPMSGAVFVGLPVTSHDNSTLATAIFDFPIVSP